MLMGPWVTYVKWGEGRWQPREGNMLLPFSCLSDPNSGWRSRSKPCPAGSRLGPKPAQAFRSDTFPHRKGLQGESSEGETGFVLQRC